MTSALIIIDMQPDFLPGGPLAVADGDLIIPGIAELVAGRGFEVCVATQDWHPAGHLSFASSHPGSAPFDEVELHGEPQVLWPDHCVQGTDGARLVADIDWRPVDMILRKGADRGVDSYSAFRNNIDARGERPDTGLAGFLRSRGVTDLTLAGLARDYCVAWSAEDGAAAGFTTHVVWDLTRSVTPDDDDALAVGLERCGVRLI